MRGKRSRSTPFCVALALACLCLLPSCAIDEWTEASNASGDLHACEEAHPKDPDACAVLRERNADAYDQYEGEAQRSWGCSGDSHPCQPYQKN